MTAELRFTKPGRVEPPASFDQWGDRCTEWTTVESSLRDPLYEALQRLVAHRLDPDLYSLAALADRYDGSDLLHTAGAKYRTLPDAGRSRAPWGMGPVFVTYRSVWSGYSEFTVSATWTEVWVTAPEVAFEEQFETLARFLAAVTEAEAAVDAAWELPR